MTRLLYLAIYLGLLSFIFWGLPDSIVYDNKQDVLSWLPFILLFLVQPFLVYKIVNTFDIRKSYVITIACLSLISVPIWGIYLEKKQDIELKEYGRTTIGIVYKKWETLRRRRHDKWLVRCRFFINGKEYSTFSENDKNNLFKVGDTLHIVYLETYPNNCIITELKDK